MHESVEMAHHTQSSTYQRRKPNLSAEKEQIKPEQQTKLQNGNRKTQSVNLPVINGWDSFEDISIVSNSGVIESGVLTHSDSQISVASQVSEDVSYRKFPNNITQASTCTHCEMSSVYHRNLLWSLDLHGRPCNFLNNNYYTEITSTYTS